MLIRKKRIPVKQILLIGILPSFLKIWVYRLMGYQIGAGVKIGFGSVLISREVQIDDGTQIGFFTIIRARKIEIDRYVSIGSFTYMEVHHLKIGDDTRIKENVYVTGYSSSNSQLIIGKRVIIMQYSFLNPAEPIIIEDDVGIGGLVCIFTHASWQNILDGYPVTFAKVVIHKNVWIAWRCFIFPGVEIGANSTIGADSTVSASIPAHSLASGSPAKVVFSGEKFWPRKISTNTQKGILAKINSEFCDYLKYHDYTVELKKHSDDLIEIYLPAVNARVIFSENGQELPEVSEHDVLVTRNCDRLSDKKGMELNLALKKRRGSTQLGEEYARFLSRYGIRFDRD